MNSYIDKKNVSIKDIRLRRVRDDDIPFLFKLLKQRNTRHNISHKKMPTYSQHKKFVSSKPYPHWHIILVGKKKVGTAYLSKMNEAGIFLERGSIGAGIGTKALKLLMIRHPRSRYLANISPKNKNSIKFFVKYGFKLIQHTYELNKLR